MSLRFLYGFEHILIVQMIFKNIFNYVTGTPESPQELNISAY